MSTHNDATRDTTRPRDASSLQPDEGDPASPAEPLVLLAALLVAFLMYAMSLMVGR